MNLKNVSIEKLEGLPQRLPRKFIINNSFEVKDSYERHGYHNDTYHTEHYRRYRRIIKASVGQNVDEVYSKVKPLLTKFYLDNDYYEKFLTDIYPAMEINGKLYTKRHTYRGLQLIHGGDLYFDDEKIIKIFPTKNKVKKDYSSFPNRIISKYFGIKKHYEHVQAKRIRDKRNDKLQNFQNNIKVRMINNVEVLKLYNSLIKQRDNLIMDMNYKIPEPPVIDYKETREKYVYGPYLDYRRRERIGGHYIKIPVNNPYLNWQNRMKDWRATNLEFERKAKKARKAYPLIQKEIEDLENGNYNRYFQSNAYLYNQQKPCHHFENP